MSFTNRAIVCSTIAICPLNLILVNTTFSKDVLDCSLTSPSHFGPKGYQCSLYVVRNDSHLLLFLRDIVKNAVYVGKLFNSNDDQFDKDF